MVQSGMKEGLENAAVLQDVTVSTFDMVVQFLNTGKYDDTKPETAPAGRTDESQFAYPMSLTPAPNCMTNIQVYVYADKILWGKLKTSALEKLEYDLLEDFVELHQDQDQVVLILEYIYEHTPNLSHEPLQKLAARYSSILFDLLVPSKRFRDFIANQEHFGKNEHISFALEDEWAGLRAWLDPMLFQLQQDHCDGLQHKARDRLLQTEIFQNWLSEPGKSLLLTGERGYLPNIRYFYISLTVTTGGVGKTALA
jgi:hypothetical protein